MAPIAIYPHTRNRSSLTNFNQGEVKNKKEAGHAQNFVHGGGSLLLSDLYVMRQEARRHNGRHHVAPVVPVAGHGSKLP
jgi:hypothetical protein